MNLQRAFADLQAVLGGDWQRLAEADKLSLIMLLALILVGLWLLVKGGGWLRRWGVQQLRLPQGAGAPWPGGAALRRQAQRLARQGEAREAGHLFEVLGDLERAATQYEKAQAYLEAAAVREQAHQWLRAAALCERGGDPVRAAEALIQAQNFKQAAVLFRKAGRELRAAEALEQARDYAAAAALYERAGSLEKAAVLYERAGSYAAGADALERCLLARYAAGRGDRAGAGTLSPDGMAALQKCAKLFRLAGQADRAANVLLHWGATGEAAQLFLEAGDPRRALDLYRAGGQIKEAMEVCQLIGAHAEYHALRAEQLTRAGNTREAAEAWEQAGELDRAAEIYRELRDWARAGELYARAGIQDVAAEMLEVAGQWAQAAATYAAARQFSEAARCYRQAGLPQEAAAALADAGDLYAAGVLMAEAGGPDDAIALLQMLPPESPRYQEGGLLLARLLLERGMLQPALMRLRIIAGQPWMEGQMAEVNYLLGRVHEDMGRLEEALSYYEQVLAERMDYQDAGARAADLRQRAQPPAALAGDGTVGSGPAGIPARYQVEREIGRGGMGIVYEAQDQVLMRSVALKVPAPAIIGSPKARERFLREARIAAGLRHPNIVTIYDAGQTQAGLYIAMALVEGITLEAYLQEHGPLAPEEFLALSRQICAGLAHAHAHGIVHGDVKPANIIVDTMGQVHLTDFGLARAWEGTDAATLEGRGTPSYIAPEQVRGEGLDARTDIYSLGCTLYRMITGAPPFTKGDVIYGHLHEEPPRLRLKRPEAPEALEAAIARCLAKQPEDRFPAVAHVLNALEAAFPPTPNLQSPAPASPGLPALSNT